MKLDIATLEAFLQAEHGIREILPKTATHDFQAIKDRISSLSREQAADLCKWVDALSHAARVLRSLQFELPTE